MLETNMFGDNAQFDHLGLVVKSITELVEDEGKIVHDEIQKVAVSFIKMNGIKVELIEPVGDNSPVRVSLKKGDKIVHICFRVRNLHHSLLVARQNGFHLIGNPVPAKAFKNNRIAWVYSRSYGLIELIEENSLE